MTREAREVIIEKHLRDGTWSTVSASGNFIEKHLGFLSAQGVNQPELH